MKLIKRIIPLALILSALVGCAGRGESFNYGPEPGSGIELPDDAVIQILCYTDEGLISMKTEWTDEERARLKEILASYSLAPFKVWVDLTYGWISASVIDNAVSLDIQSENLSMSIKSVGPSSVNDGLRYYVYTNINEIMGFVDIEKWREIWPDYKKEVIA